MAKFREKILQKAAGAIFRAKEKADRVYNQPGSIINDGVEAVIKNPISSLGFAAGKITDVTHPVTLAIPKSSIALAVGNKVIPKKGRDYLAKKALQYHNSALAKRINSVPSVPRLAQAAQGLGRGVGLG